MNNDRNASRRSFIKKTAGVSAMAIGFTHILSDAHSGPRTAKVALRKDDIILFQGDSITDAGRKRDENSANNSRALGNGYAYLASAKLLHDHSGKNLQIYNRGISGNKVFQLADRWQSDCLDLKPTVLSILIGVNDFWHMLNGKYDGTVETYRNDLQVLLERTKKELPNVRLIIGEPFAVKDVKAVDSSWFPRFGEYQKAARDLAGKFDAAFIPYQKIFDAATKSAPPVYWTHDGVHPSLAGSQLMAEAFLSTIGK